MTADSAAAAQPSTHTPGERRFEELLRDERAAAAAEACVEQIRAVASAG